MSSLCTRLSQSEMHADAVEAEFMVAEGQRLPFVLRYGSLNEPVPESPDAEAALVGTQAYWRDWTGRF